MKEIVYRTMDEKKAEWGPGPWTDEPDKIQWQDEATGLPCLAKRNRMGAWCGYVGVSEGHPAYGQGYNAVHDLYPNLEVHGGLTYADFCQEGPEEITICHIPAAGEPDHVFWLGYDCAHAFDLVPYMETDRRKRYEETGAELWARDLGDIYRDLEYVKRETTNLARQLAQEPGPNTLSKEEDGTK